NIAGLLCADFQEGAGGVGWNEQNQQADQKKRKERNCARPSEESNRGHPRPITHTISLLRSSKADCGYRICGRFYRAIANFQSADRAPPRFAQAQGQCHCPSGQKKRAWDDRCFRPSLRPSTPVLKKTPCSSAFNPLSPGCPRRGAL